MEIPLGEMDQKKYRGDIACAFNLSVSLTAMAGRALQITRQGRRHVTSSRVARRCTPQVFQRNNTYNIDGVLNSKSSPSSSELGNDAGRSRDETA